MPACLFCRNELDGKQVVEHMIPRSMGGAGHFLSWLVCSGCNHTLGQLVDTICDEHPLLPLRYELGLVDELPTTYKREGLDTEIRAVLNSNGELVDTQLVYENADGKSFTILGKTKADVEKTANEIAAKKAARAIAKGESPPKLIGKVEHSASGVAQNTLKGDVDAMKQKLERFGAKVAIEYISRVTDRAMDRSLDALRKLAIAGGGTDGFEVVFVGGGLYWLPSTQQTLFLTDNPELLNAVSTELEPGKRHGQAETVARFVHSVELDGGRNVLRLTLFSIIRITVPLPAIGLPSVPAESMELPYVASDWRVLTT